MARPPASLDGMGVAMPRRGVSRYQPLLDYLRSSPESEVVLTVAAVEAVLGFPLPKMAHFDNWWRDPSRSQAALWWDAGWRAHLDPRNQRVIFTRDTER